MENIQIDVSSQLQRKHEVLSHEFGLSKEETVIFIINTFFFEKSEIISKSMENL